MSSNVAKNRDSLSSGADDGLVASLSRAVSESPMTVATRRAATDAKVVAKKLLWSTGRAAWIAGTTFLILAVPLIIEMDREQQFNDLELQQQSLLGSPPPASALK